MLQHRYVSSLSVIAGTEVLSGAAAEADPLSLEPSTMDGLSGYAVSKRVSEALVVQVCAFFLYVVCLCACACACMVYVLSLIHI